MQVASIDALAAGATPITLDGGTLQALGNLNLTTPISLGEGGGTIDVNGWTVTADVAAPVGSTASFAAIDSNGGGLLRLGGDNYSSGGTDIEAAVQLTGAYALGSGDLTVNATLDLMGFSRPPSTACGAAGPSRPVPPTRPLR